MAWGKSQTRWVLTLFFFFSLAGKSAYAQFPYENTPANDMSILGAGTALFGLGYWVENFGDGHNSHPHLILCDHRVIDPQTINFLDRPATNNWSPQAAELSDVFMYSSAWAPLSLVVTDVGSKQPLTITTMHLETLLLNGGATYLLKNIFGRARPFVQNKDPRIPDSLRQSRTARRSFPSGHTSTSFASMVFMASVFSNLYPESAARHWVWGGCLTVAATTGYLRYDAGWHYPTDILAGAALGALVGWLVPHLHELESEMSDPQKSKSLPLTLGFSVAF